MRVALLVLCILGPPLLAQETAPAPEVPAETPISLEQAVELALARNELLGAARLEIPVARAGVDVARQRPNPDLTIEEARETPRDAVGLAFPIETAGKRGRRIRVADEGALAVEAEIARKALAVRNDTRRAYYALVGAKRRVREGKEVQALAERVHAAASQRFEAGAAPRLEVLTAELAAARAESDVLAAEATASAARSDLNLLLARAPGHPTEVDGDLGAGEVPDLEPALDSAVAASADVAVLDRRIAEQEARVELARAERWPDPVVEGVLTHRAQPEFDYGWRALLTVTLPIFHHHAAEVGVEESQLARLRAEREAEVSKIRSAAYAGLAFAKAQREQYLRYHDRILPTTDEVEKMAEDAYRSGQTSLVAMIQAVQGVRELRLRAIDAGLAYQTSLADLERALGAALP